MHCFATLLYYLTVIFVVVSLQTIGLSLRDLLAHVDEEIQRLDPSSHKEVSLHRFLCIYSNNDYVNSVVGLLISNSIFFSPMAKKIECLCWCIL